MPFLFLGIFIIIILAYGAIYPGTHLFGRIVIHGDRDRQEVALTFDDGPYGDATERILDVLKEKNVPAAFFIVGENATRYPELVQREIADGHIIGNHSLSHGKHLALQSPGGVKADAITADEHIYSAAKVHPRFFRFPYGLKSPQAIWALSKKDYSIISWDVMTSDYNKKREPEWIADRILARLQPGSIIVLHDGRDTHREYSRDNMITALPLIIDGIRRRGYTIVRLDRLIEQEPYFPARVHQNVV